MPRRKVAVVLVITLFSCLGSLSAHARWTGKLFPSPNQTDCSLIVKLRFEAVGKPMTDSGGHITDLGLLIWNETDSPVTILWNKSTLRLLRPLGRPELVLPFRHVDPETTETVLCSRERCVQAVGYRMVQVTEESRLVLLLTVETAKGSHQEEWRGSFRFVEDEPEDDTNVWLIAAIAAAVLLGIVVLLPMLGS
jgi:hypothetical protein